MEADSTDIFGPWMAESYARRHFERWSIERQANVTASGRSQRCVMRDISPGGARVSFEKPPEKMPSGSFVNLSIADFGVVPSEVRHLCDFGRTARP